MQLKELLEDLLIQAEEQGIVQEGSLDFELEKIDLHDTVVATIVFHVDLTKEEKKVPHLDALKVVWFTGEAIAAAQDALPPPAPEQFPEDFRPKGWG